LIEYDDLPAIQVPNGHWDVFQWSTSSQDFVKTKNSDVICYADKAADQSPMTNCQLFTTLVSNAKPGQVELLKMVYNTQVDLTRKSKNAVAGDFLQNDQMKLTLTNFKIGQDDSTVTFSINDDR
jgi:hypothetical protein